MIDYTDQATAVLATLDRMRGSGKTSYTELVSFMRAALEHAAERVLEESGGLREEVEKIT